jgi:hypothetical protein
VGTGRSGRRALAVLAIAGLGLMLTACGDDDDDDAAAAQEADGGDNNADDDNNNDNNDGDNGGDVSDDCKDALRDYLEELEPFIEDIDWTNASLDTMSSVEEEMGDELDDADAKLQEECGEFDFSAESGQLEAALEVANDDAPGTVAFLTFIQGLSQAVADISVPDVTFPDNVTLPENVTIPDITIPDVTIPDVTIPDMTVPGAADLPTDCDGAKLYIEDLMEEYDTMMDMPVSELTAVGTVVGTLSSACSPNDLQEFYNRAEVQAFLSGT